MSAVKKVIAAFGQWRPSRPEKVEKGYVELKGGYKKYLGNVLREAKLANVGRFPPEYAVTRNNQTIVVRNRSDFIFLLFNFPNSKLPDGLRKSLLVRFQFQLEQENQPGE